MFRTEITFLPVNNYPDAHHSQGVWNLPHKFHLYLIMCILLKNFQLGKVSQSTNVWEKLVNIISLKFFLHLTTKLYNTNIVVYFQSVLWEVLFECQCQIIFGQCMLHICLSLNVVHILCSLHFDLNYKQFRVCL